MAIYTTYTKARADFSNLLNSASDNKEIIYISRRNSEDIALISASELAGLMETAHLLRSPKNAQRLLAALNRAVSRTEIPQGIEEFREQVGLE